MSPNLFLSKSKVCLFVIYELYQEVVLTGSHQGTTICTIQKTCKSISIVNRLEIIVFTQPIFYLCR